MYAKRKRSSSVSSRKPYAKRARSAKARGRTGYANVLRSSVARANKGVARLTRMIETKEGCYKTSAVNVGYLHNVPALIANGAPGNNIFAKSNGTDDPMNGNALVIIGDQISLKGVKATFMLENSPQRSRVFYRIMFLRGPRGATFLDLFKGISGNKMIDQFNTEKYKIIASKRVTVSSANAAMGLVAFGKPYIDNATGVVYGGEAQKIVNFWIPGKAITKSGNLQYENNSSNVKFYDYRWVMLCYDMYGALETDDVGRINEGYFKIYFKDA